MATPHGLSPNKLVEELSVWALTEHDTEARFWMRAARGEPVRELKLLDRPHHWHTRSANPDVE